MELTFTISREMKGFSDSETKEICSGKTCFAKVLKKFVGVKPAEVRQTDTNKKVQRDQEVRVEHRLFRLSF